MHSALIGCLLCASLILLIVSFYADENASWSGVFEKGFSDISDDQWAEKWEKIKSGIESYLELFGIKSLDDVTFLVAQPESAGSAAYKFKEIDFFSPSRSTPSLRCRSIAVTVELGDSDYHRFEEARLRYISHQPLDCMMKFVIPHIRWRYYGAYSKVLGFLLVPPLVSGGAIVLRVSENETEYTIMERREQIIRSPFSLAVPDYLLQETPWIMVMDSDTVFTNDNESVYSVSQRIERALTLPPLLPNASAVIDPEWVTDIRKLQWVMVPDWDTWKGPHRGFNAGVQMYKPGVAMALLSLFIGLQYQEGRKPIEFNLQDQGWFCVVAGNVFGIHNITQFNPSLMTEDQWMGRGADGENHLLAIGRFTSNRFGRQSELNEFDTALKLWNSLEAPDNSVYKAPIIEREYFFQDKPVIMAVASGRWMNALAPPKKKEHPDYAYWHPGDFIFHAAGFGKKHGTLKLRHKSLKSLQRKHIIPEF